MIRSIVGGVLLLVLVFVHGSVTAKPPEKGGDKITEKPADKDAPVWEWVLYNENDKKVAEGHFVVRGFTLWNGNGKRVGSYEDVGKDRDHVKVDIAEGKFKAKVDLLKEKDTEGTWKGEFDNDKGGKYKVTILFKNWKR